MPDTTPRGIQFPVPGDQITDLDAKFESLATTADTAIGDALVLPARWMRNASASGYSSNSWISPGGWIDDAGSSAASGISYSNSVFTVSEAGIYRAYLSWAWEATGVDAFLRACRLVHNGTTEVALCGNSFAGLVSSQLAFNCTLPRIQLASNDTITGQVFQSSGSGKTRSPATGATIFAIEMLQPL